PYRAQVPALDRPVDPEDRQAAAEQHRREDRRLEELGELGAGRRPLLGGRAQEEVRREQDEEDHPFRRDHDDHAPPRLVVAARRRLRRLDEHGGEHFGGSGDGHDGSSPVFQAHASRPMTPTATPTAPTSTTFTSSPTKNTVMPSASTSG